MNPIPKPTLKQVFNDILEATPHDRAEMLARLGSDDPPLRERVEHLLAANDRAGAFLTAPTANPDNADDDSAAAQEMRVGSASVISMSAGTQVGPYRLLERLGEGGFGEVWAAEQTQPIRRKLALKILKAGMDTKEVLARFAAERQALAMMDHQHIARVYDAGATDAGRPYFVMELVAGLPITDFCDAARRTETLAVSSVRASSPTYAPGSAPAAAPSPAVGWSSSIRVALRVPVTMQLP